jgi:hypothetical protein
MKAFLSIVFPLALLLISAESAGACICSPHTAGSEFSRSDVVGIFKVKNKKGENLVFLVEKVYKGDANVGDEIEVRNSGCSIISERPVAAGMTFLLYLNTAGGTSDTLEVVMCSRSGTVDRVKTDLIWLDKLDQVKGQSRFSGTIWQEGETIGDYWKCLANWPVTIQGNGKVYALKTNNDGFYEIYGLPPGVYEVTPAPVQGYDFYHASNPANPSEYERTIYLNNSHAEWDISFTIATSIMGRLVDADGLPVEGIEIVVLKQDDKGRIGSTGIKTLTGKDGYFKLRTVPEGTVVIEVTGEWITKRIPADGFYYSSDGNFSEGNFEKPTPITIKKGQIIKDLLITAPKVGPRAKE